MEIRLSRLLEEIKVGISQTSWATGISELSENVLQALIDVPRYQFVSTKDRDRSYENRPLPIGFGQTISQPFMVAIMTELLKLEPHYQVLEIGTGSGYQSAILSRLVDKVYTLERNSALQMQAVKRFQYLKYDNIIAKQGDGYHGWPEYAPYDAMMVTAAALEIPPALIFQLKPRARLIIPIGEKFSQALILVHKDDNGQIHSQKIMDVSFVPLVRDDEPN